MPLPRFRPSLFTALAGYDRARFLRDLSAGLVVGIVAIPLSLAFAIASGVPPEAGLATAVVAGFLISFLGGSRVQIGGPTGAFVVIVFGIVAEHGVSGLILATFMAGVILLLFGLFRLGRLISFIPMPVVTGFTAGIGAIIFISQLREVFGLETGALPGETVEKMVVLWEHVSTVNPAALGIALGTVLTIVAFKRWLPRIPGPVVALVVFTGAAYYFHLPAETVGDRFGALPSGLPAPKIPHIDLGLLRTLLPAALTIALLGAIESLLSAVVADAMVEDRHDPDQELMAQGLANLASPLFGGIPATGAIARTATNVHNGGTTPIAGIVHAAVVFLFVTFLASTVSLIPLAALGGVLVVVAYNMSDIPRFARALKMPRGDAAVLLATFLITVFIDLVVAVEVGMVLAAFLFMMRMSRVASVEVIRPEEDRHYVQQSIHDKDVPSGVMVYSIDGPFFFGAAERFQRTVEAVAEIPPVVIFRMRHVPYMDATGLTTFQAICRHYHKRGTHVILSAVQNQPFAMMQRAGFFTGIGDENVARNIDEALKRARQILENGIAAPTPAAHPGH